MARLIHNAPELLAGVPGISAKEAESIVARNRGNSVQASIELAEKRMQKVLFQSGLTPAHFWLMSQLGKLKSTFLDRVESGELQFFDQRFFLRKDLTGSNSGRVKMLLETNDRTDGVTNIDKNKLGEDTVAALVGLKLAYVQAATAGSPTAQTVEYQQVFDAAGIDDAMINAELEIDVENRRVFRGPVNQFFRSAADSFVSNGKEVIVPLTSPKLIEGTKPINLEIVFPSGSSMDVSTNSHFLEVTLITVAIMPR